MKVTTDVLIVGSGIAGLISAIDLANKGYRVVVSAKEAVTESSSYYSQGGIAVPLHPSDSIDKHVADTIQVGGDKVCPEVAYHYISKIQTCVNRLAGWGVPFDNLESPDSLGREGAHSERRIVTVGQSGLTGRLLMKTLWVLACRHPNISVAQGNILVKLLKNSQGECIGGVFLDLNTNLFPIFASQTILATGGFASLFLCSTNPSVNTGDGISIAYQSGARIEGLQHIQLHPTATNVNMQEHFTDLRREDRYILLSEALRGEGAILVNADGERFMFKYSPDKKELDSRMVVSNAIGQEERKSGKVFLDWRPIGQETIMSRFEGLYIMCKDLGMDPFEEPIPVTPAAHYTIGGIQVDLEQKTSVKGLRAIGECTFSGFHGRDRLASNSLLECIVGAFTIGESIDESTMIKDLSPVDDVYVSEADYYEAPSLDIERNIQDLRELMWDLMISNQRPQKSNTSLKHIEMLEDKHSILFAKYIDPNVNQLRNMCILSKLLIAAWE